MSMMSKALGFLRGGAAPLPVSEGAAPLPVSDGPARKRPLSGYMRSGRGVVFNNWRPALREDQDNIGEAWDDAAARAQDSIINSGWLSGMIDQSVANTVGTGLRLKAMPENSLFGMSNADAQAWARKTERAFEMWARSKQECDIEGLRTFGQQQAAVFRSWLGTGEVLAELPYRKRAWNRYGTKVRILPPQRLSRESNSMKRLVNGIYLDQDGMPVGYRARKKDPLLGMISYDVRARDGYGRPNVIHIFDGLPGTYRGIGPMTPALQVARQFDQLSDATLTAAIVQTLFAVTITSDAPTEETLAGLLTPQEQAQMAANGVSPMEAYLDMAGGYYDGSSTLNVGVNGRLSHLFPGQTMDFHSTEHPGPDYKAFSQHLLRELARSAGMTYESATGDYGGSTYYSLGKSTGEIFEITKARRANILAPFCQPIYEAWLEEAIELGDIPFPGGIDNFLLNRAAACRADWRGSPKPMADELKAAKAHELWNRMGVLPGSVISNDLGMDYEDVCQAFQQDKETREAYGVPEPIQFSPTGGAPKGGASGEPGDQEDNTDDGGGDGADN